MGIEENKAILRGIVAILNGKADPSQASELIAPGMVDHQGIPGIDTNGPDGFKNVVTVYRMAFPDLMADETDIVAEGDLVVAHYHMTATNTGEFMGMPATNRKIDIQGVDIIRCEAGKAVEHWGQKMMTQLGMMPENPQT